MNELELELKGIADDEGLKMLQLVVGCLEQP